jgi:hypothetical protein
LWWDASLVSVALVKTAHRAASFLGYNDRAASLDDLTSQLITALVLLRDPFVRQAI